MKQIVLIFFLCIVISKVKATHDKGGQIYWECLGNGSYIFHLERIIGCNSTYLGNYSTDSLILNVYGSLLPRDTNNNAIQQIKVFSDVTKFISNNSGELFEKCNSSGPQASCNLNPSSGKHYYYKSKPIRLSGVPPSNGWSFVYHGQGTSYKNVFQYNFLLQAKMFPYQNINTINCYDNSPYFSDAGTEEIVTNLRSYPNLFAYDIDQNDSISYHFETPQIYNSNGFQSINYVPPYTLNNPLGIQGVNQEQLTLDSSSSLSYVKLNSNSTGSYLVTIRVDSWRNKEKIASVYLKKNLIVLNSNSIRNNSIPILQLNFSSMNQIIYRTVLVGSTIRIPISVQDLDLRNGTFQSVELFAEGQQFSNNFIDTSLCDYPPCAIFQNGAFQYDTLNERFQRKAAGTVLSAFVWHTSINHLTNNGKSKTHFFKINTVDDECPFTNTQSRMMVITVNPLTTNLTEYNQVKVDIFPNPSNGQINIETEVEIRSIELRTIDGREVNSNWNSQPKTLQLPEEKGIYFIQLETANGLKVTKKVMKL